MTQRFFGYNAGGKSLRDSFGMQTAMLSSGARKTPRRKMGARAWIRPDDGFSVRKCIISDISPTGVRLLVDSSTATMKQFRLLMTRDALQGCHCRVRWRRGEEIGAEFLR